MRSAQTAGLGLRRPAAVALLGLLLTAGAAAAQACRLEPLGTGTVRAFSDDASLMLDDGRSVRLDGIDVGPVTQAAPLPPLTGQAVTLRGRSAVPDRYGRIRAFVYVEGKEADGPVQYAMLSAGQARVSGRGLDKACLDALVERERRARKAGLGIWSIPAYAVKHAEDAAGVQASRGRFALVEGRVLSVRESGGTIYVNFGRRWSEDFTVTIAKRNERIFTAAGLAPQRLERRQVRVRGFVEERGGPWIELTGPEQIELIESN
jgi:hypothetical protein